MNGCSTAWPPIHVNINKATTRIQNIHWLIGRNIMCRCLAVCRSGITARIKIDRMMARTPPSLLGIDGKIAQADRKYHFV